MHASKAFTLLAISCVYVCVCVLTCRIDWLCCCLSFACIVPGMVRLFWPVLLCRGNLRSGLYGVLRPLDAIEPYRLEMGSKLKTHRGKTLYDYWGEQIAKALNEQAVATGSQFLVNCASQEYFGAVDRSTLTPQVITPLFKERKGGTSKIVSFFAKKARGAMARYIVQNRLTQVSDLLAFGSGGYSYQPDQSDADTLVFERDYPQAAS